ncbi:hypothetical protein LTR17_008344 [Elasticomyces elasticus]|nr:hypothetical protein LTR17_008344 [Elasticomyces elasticus]
MADTSRAVEDETVPREGALDLEVVTLVKVEDEEQKPVLEKQETAPEVDEKEALSSKPHALADEQTALSDEEEAVEHGEVALSEEKKAFGVVKAAFEAEKAAFMAEKASQASRQTADCATQTDEMEVKSSLLKRMVEPHLEALDERHAKRQQVIDDLLAAELDNEAGGMRSPVPDSRLGTDLGYSWSQVAEHTQEPDYAFELPLPSPAVVKGPVSASSSATGIPAAPVEVDPTANDDNYTGRSRIPARANRKRLSEPDCRVLCQFIFVEVARRRRYFAALSKEVQDRILKDVYGFYRKGNRVLKILETPFQDASTKKIYCAGCRAQSLMWDLTAEGPACGRCQAAKRVSIRVTGDGSTDPELVALPEEQQAGLGPDDVGYYVVR